MRAALVIVGLVVLVPATVALSIFWARILRPLLVTQRQLLDLLKASRFTSDYKNLAAYKAMLETEPSILFAASSMHLKIYLRDQHLPVGRVEPILDLLADVTGIHGIFGPWISASDRLETMKVAEAWQTYILYDHVTVYVERDRSSGRGRS